MKAPTLVALDSNVWLRYLLDDDAKQSPQARALLQNATRTKMRFLLPITVVLEIAWVLRSRGADTAAVILGLQTLLGLANVYAPEQDAIVKALAWHEQGMDFADALHLAASASADEFRTFDLRFLKTAGREVTQPIVQGVE